MLPSLQTARVAVIWRNSYQYSDMAQRYQSPSAYLPSVMRRPELVWQQKLDTIPPTLQCRRWEGLPETAADFVILLRRHEFLKEIVHANSKEDVLDAESIELQILKDQVSNGTILSRRRCSLRTIQTSIRAYGPVLLQLESGDGVRQLKRLQIRSARNMGFQDTVFVLAPETTR
ncbi:uncharacterized protein [Physcomitrium patens]|uniref:uncharacterized protein isoform X2 n=1 Tax=Physcomitrium patens TaxID=3218 RepID=UPI003CCE1D30